MAGMTLNGPILRDGRCVFEFGGSRFEVEPSVGGRLISARVGSTELLVGTDVHASNYGSTFWTSPQSDWEWPPVAAIDSGAYDVSSDATSCTLTSARVSGSADVVNDIVVTKRFSADLAAGALVVTYTIRNQGRAPKRLAPWEITRVAAFGLTFFATDGAPYAAPGRPLPALTRSAGCAWFQYVDAVEHHAKLLADGKGWIAHVTPQNLLLVKSFPDITSELCAPGEAEIEIYASNPEGMPEARYVEIENQGAYAAIAPGDACTWTVRWFLQALPENLTPFAGSAELVGLAERLVETRH